MSPNDIIDKLNSLAILFNNSCSILLKWVVSSIKITLGLSLLTFNFSLNLISVAFKCNTPTPFEFSDCLTSDNSINCLFLATLLIELVRRSNTEFPSLVGSKNILNNSFLDFVSNLNLETSS